MNKMQCNGDERTEMCPPQNTLKRRLKNEAVILIFSCCPACFREKETFYHNICDILWGYVPELMFNR